jgi:L-alanine-DL-glutamate epimerase-like enolase superfamily enzyme
MKIVDVEAIPVAYPEPNDNGGTRHLLFVRITAGDGQTGWGEAVTMWPEATHATATLVDGLAPLVVGRDPMDHAAIHQALKTHTWWYGNGGLAAFAISALDIALWDLAGKSCGLSLLDLVGGAVHDSLPVLVSSHATMADLDEMAATMAGWVDEHQAAGIKVGFGKRGDAALGVDEARDVSFVAALRRELGPHKAIMIDLGASIHWDVRTAIRRTRAFEEYDIAWIEEPLGADDPAGYAELRDRVTTKIAYGEREWTPRGIERILATKTVDVIGVDPGRCEGVTGWLAAAAHTRAAGREINAHAWSSAVVTAASLALSFASPHCHQVEIKPLRNPMQHELPTTPIQAVDGRFRPPTAPGLGVEIDETVLAHYTSRAG